MGKASLLVAKSLQKTKKSAVNVKVPEWYTFATYLVTGVFLVILLVSWLRPDDPFADSATYSEPVALPVPQTIPKQDSASAVSLAPTVTATGSILVGDIQVPQAAVQSARAIVYALFTGSGKSIVMYSGSVFPPTYVTYQDPEVTGPTGASSQTADSYTLSFDVDPDATGPEYAVSQTVTVIKQENIWAYFP